MVNMKKMLLLLISILILVEFGISQRKQIKNVNVKGKVVYKNSKKPLEYSTITFINPKTKKNVGGGITDVKGLFSIDIPAGKYNIAVEFIGFKPMSIENKQISKNTNLGIFELEEDINMLESATVTAEKTSVELKLDKKIYNIGRDLTLSGGNVEDVLDNIPSVTVDEDGNIALRGNDNVRILINGKPSGLAGINSSDGLKQLPAESIEKVEIITSPSARYDAEGTAGILNIILKRSKLQGLNGSITANAGNPFSTGLSASLNYRLGDVNIFTTSSYRNGEREGNSENLTQYFNKAKNNAGELIDNPDTYLNEYNDFIRKNKNINTNVGLEWYINNSTSITISSLYRNGKGNNSIMNKISQFNDINELLSKSLRNEEDKRDDKSLEHTFNFTKNFNKDGHKLTADFVYSDNKDFKDGSISNNDIKNELITTDETQKRILAQTDYVLPINDNSQFEFGYKGNFVNTNTDYKVSIWNGSDFTIDDNISNIFDYKQNIQSLYTQFGSKLGKLTYLLGLRYEFTELTINNDYKKNYGGIFPTINLNYYLTEKQSISLAYARRLRRPYSRFINPFPSRSSMYNISKGNEKLDPTYSGTFDIGYLGQFDKFTFTSSLYYQHSKDVFTFISIETGDKVIVDNREVPIVMRTPINLSTSDRYGFEFNANYNPIRKWRMDANLNIYKYATKGNYNNTIYDAEDFSWSFRFTNKLTLPLDINWQTRFMYRGGSKDAQNSRNGFLSMDMSLSKDFWQQKASITLNVRDVLNTRKFSSTTITPTFYKESSFRMGTRSINISFTYRFNQKKNQKRPSRSMKEEGMGDEEFMM